MEVAPHAGAWIETRRDKIIDRTLLSRAPCGRVDCPASTRPNKFSTYWDDGDSAVVSVTPRAEKHRSRHGASAGSARRDMSRSPYEHVENGSSRSADENVAAGCTILSIRVRMIRSVSVHNLLLRLFVVRRKYVAKLLLRAMLAAA